MNEFETYIGKTFQALRDAKQANAFFLHPPMRVAGMHGKVPCYVQAGKAPYDMGGFYYDSNATAIGVELKQTKDHEHSIAIVGPGKKGSGLQYHQLEALVDLHLAGGVALLLWSNGGELGLATGELLHLAKIQYDTSLKAENLKQTPAKGSRSILWGHFKLVKYGHLNMPLWLPRPPECKGKSK